MKEQSLFFHGYNCIRRHKKRKLEINQNKQVFCFEIQVVFLDEADRSALFSSRLHGRANEKGEDLCLS